MMVHIRDSAAGGHSFGIVVDPDDSEYEKTFGFAGAGSARILSVEMGSKKYA